MHRSSLTGRVVVAVPVKDEAERIAACLRALANQKDSAYDAIVLVVNNTSETTAVIVRESAGSARWMAMERATTLARPSGTVLTTDADGQVPVDWVAANLFLCGTG